MPEVQPDRDQPLLGAVVEVAGQAAALLVGDGDDPGPGGVQLLQPAAQLDLERRDLQCQPPGVDDVGDQPGVGVPVADEGDDVVPGVDGGDASTGLRRSAPAGDR